MIYLYDIANGGGEGWMNIMIAGGTGFVGQALTAALLSRGHDVYILTRNADRDFGEKADDQVDERGKVHYIPWSRGMVEQPVREALPVIDAIVNLAGESLNSGRWTAKRKQRIVQSRVQSTKGLVEMIEAMSIKPKVMINASAIGYYGISKTAVMTEQSPAGNDFLANVVQQWEKEANRAQSMVRVVCMRFGLILGKNGGALPTIAMAYRMYMGGTLGSGNQFYSWIHIDDIVGMICFALQETSVHGIFNAVSPNPVVMREFGKTLASVLQRPHWLPAPGFAIRAVLGEMSILVLEGQRVLPERMLEQGYVFRHPTLREALQNIYSS